MDNIFYYSSVFIALIMFVSLYRAVAIGSKTVPLLILIGLMYERVEMFIDIALAYAMLNFVAVLAASRYFQKRKGLDRE
jgi:multicomponent Na+:H+ antiporter subunit F